MAVEPQRLSRQQDRLIRQAVHRQERLAISAATLVEIAREVAAMGDSLKDPNDRVIVATARVRGLRLVTSDERIIDSALVPVVE